MKIGVIRHANVLYHDPLFSNGERFNAGRIAYDMAEISKVKFEIKVEDFPVCYVSPRSRAIETVKMIYQGTYIIHDDLVEVKNNAYFLLKLHVPSFIRAVMGRVAWYFNYHIMPETRTQSNERARKFIRFILEKNNQNVLLVTHGFFMQSLRHELRKQGFKGSLPYLPKNARLYVFEK